MHSPFDVPILLGQTATCIACTALLYFHARKSSWTGSDRTQVHINILYTIFFCESVTGLVQTLARSS